MTEAALREEMCEIGRRLWQRGLVGAAEGNISARLDSKYVLCTPAGISKGHMRPEDLVVVTYTGETISLGTPTSEIALHLRCYELRQDCHAVVHAHPIVSTALALIGEAIPDNLLPEAAIVLGSVAIASFGRPGTSETPDSITELLSRHNTFLLSNHGAVTLGSGIENAYNRMETLERMARVYAAADRLGDQRPLPADAADWLLPYLENPSL